MRLDVCLVERGLAKSRTLAARLIEEGSVKVNSVPAKKASLSVSETDEIVVEESVLCRFVSRGGLKLSAALSAFEVGVFGLRAFDFGASTGGFTDCLLQAGAAHVFSVDVGQSQFSESLRGDSRVTVLEKTDARTLDLTAEHGKMDLGVMDVSFISQSLLYESCARNLKNGARLITLFKPQFEVGREHVAKGGIVKDARARDAARTRLIEQAAAFGLQYEAHVPSPILGGDGNAEELICFVRCENV